LENKDKRFISIEWESHTLPYTPHLNGLYTTGVEEDDIVCCSRTEVYRNAILVGDRYSKIKLFNYPSIDNVIYNKYEGHSNAVTAVQFSPNKNYDYAISLGGEEKSILIWKFDPVTKNNTY
jgi:WD40 repeat protein